MAELLTTELKDDLEYIYKTTGDIYNLLQSKSFDNESDEIKELMDLIMFRLEDIDGILQKDIFNCDYLITKYKLITHPEYEH